jgi:hypothetical protein
MKHQCEVRKCPNEATYIFYWAEGRRSYVCSEHHRVMAKPPTIRIEKINEEH